jgi:triosephosphate isomerase (TIM)
MSKNKKLIIANWKLNPTNLKDAKKLFIDIKKTASKTQKVQIVICPPSIYINELNKMYSGHRITLGAQDAFWENKGSYTGELSPMALKSIGAKYVIIGHSERRALGESNTDVNKKVINILKNKLNVILCVGESKRDSQAFYLKFLREELESALSDVPQNYLKNLIIAYEPLWAIGKSVDNAVSPHQMHEMYLFIKKILIEIYTKNIAFSVPIIYGGSVEPDNVKGLLDSGEIDGFLVGHASLKAEQFNEILKITNAGK